MIIPKYLEEISENIKISRNIEVVKLKCKCGCNHFVVYEFCSQDNVTINPSFNEIIRENGKRFLIKRNFLGKIVKKIDCDCVFKKKQRRIIKVKCEKCGLEYVIFDNYIHGYDAFAMKKEYSKLNDKKTFDFKKVYNQSLEVYVMISQNLSYDEFKDELENRNIDYDSYLSAFENINIYGINLKSKKIKICSEETA